MTRHDSIFDITYSYHLENMHSILTGRIDRAITFIIIAAGCSVFASLNHYALFGVLIACLSICQVVYQFGRNSGISEDQAKRYKLLIIEVEECDDAELNNRYKSLHSLDTSPWGILCNAAFKRACIVLGLPSGTPELTFMEKCFACLAGDLPRE